MPYYDHELQDLIGQLGLWADLRTEQGAAVAPIVADTKRALRKALRDVKRVKTDPLLRDREPDTLEAIRRLRPAGPRKLWEKLPARGLEKRLKGAWLGRAAGCTLGAPVEMWSVEGMMELARSHGDAFPPRDYWSGHPSADTKRYGTSTVRDYLRDGIREIPVDDDLTYTVLGLAILERFGPAFTTGDVGRTWLDELPMACTAERVALENLKAGVPATKAALRNNPYVEWIGADIRSDPWAYAAPGWPERAAAMAWRDAFLSHRRNGLYGAMFFAAAMAAAFAVQDAEEALCVGLTEIPARCRLAEDLRWALETAPGLSGWREARDAVDQRFPGMSPVHTNNNACLTVFGLLLGGGDFTKTIGITVAMGLDNDCTAATAGSLLGAILGIDGIPGHWWKPFRNRCRTYLHNHGHIRNNDLVKRFMGQAARVWAVNDEV